MLAVAGRRVRLGPAAGPAAAACGPGLICTWAGNGEPAFYGDGLDRREAMLYWPIDLAFAPDGRAYVLDWQNHRVRRVNADDKFETVLGTGDVGDGPDTGDERTAPGVAGTDCNLNHPTDVDVRPRRHRSSSPPGTTTRSGGWIPPPAWKRCVSGAGPGFKGDGMPALGALLTSRSRWPSAARPARSTSPTRATSACGASAATA